MKKIICLFLSFIYLFSCTKEGGNVSAEGRVYNPITGEGYEGFEIKLTEDTHIGGAPGAQSSDSRTISSVKSDSDGNYSLSGVALGVGATLRFFTDHSEFYKIGIGNNTVTGEPNEYSTIGLKSGKHNKVDFWVVPYGNLKLDILNVNCEGEDDKLFYKRIWVTYNQETNGVTRFGCFQFNGNYFQLPIGEYKYEWEVTRNSETTYHDTTFNILENGFHTVTIHY